MKSTIWVLSAAALLFAACEPFSFQLSLFDSHKSLQSMVLSEEGGHDTDKGKENCFSLLYPISISMPDGSILSGEEEELWGAVKDWYEANPDSKAKPNLIYPVDVLFKDGTSETVEDKSEMEDLKADCDTRCFELVYPISWTMPDGSTADMNGEGDWDAIKAWYEDHPESEEKPDLNYPVDIVYEDGTNQTVGDENEMESIKEDCD